MLGHSAGVYLALTEGYRESPPPQAIVPFYGYGDIAAKWYTEPSPFYLQQPHVSAKEALQSIRGGPCGRETPDSRWHYYPYVWQRGLWPKEVTVIDPRKSLKVLDPYCPLHNISSDYPPTLLIHGDKGNDVPFEQSEMLYRALKRERVQCQLIPVPGGEHMFDNARISDPQARAAFDRVIAFLKENLRR